MDWFVYDNDLRHERFISKWVKIQKEEKKNERKTKK